MNHSITAENAEFILLSFEGPDRYSLAGGLGVRVTNLSQTLAALGFPTHLFFVGDPSLPGEETMPGRPTLHRWCQWISRYHPNGVYQGENEKLYDYHRSIPPYITEHVVRPALKQGKLVVIMGEEWHTAETMCRIAELLASQGLRERVVLFWNANNTFGFDRIDWKSLSRAASLTTVSRYMKQILQGMGLHSQVLPNGIPRSLLKQVDLEASSALRNCLEADYVLAKVARWDPDKRWDSAVAAVAHLKARGKKALLLARGGLEPYGSQVLAEARAFGLKVSQAYTPGDTILDYLEALNGAEGADILELKFHCPQEFLRLVYHASDAVLANSSHEPFGLVGLETMAAGGMAFTGGTGEDYAIPFHNSIVLETSDPREMAGYVAYLEEHPAEAERMRRMARETARLFTWEKVLEYLIRKLEFRARAQGLLSIAPESNYAPLAVPVEEAGVAGSEVTSQAAVTRA